MYNVPFRSSNKIRIWVGQRNNLWNDLILENGFLIRVNLVSKIGFLTISTALSGENMTTAKDSKLECLTSLNLFKHMAIQTFLLYAGVYVDPSDADRVIDPIIKGL